jgi:hypothetical protein
MLVPREALKGFGFFPVTRPQFAFATGGEVTSQTTIERSSISIPVTVNAPADAKLVEKLRDGIERLVVKIMKEETRD